MISKALNATIGVFAVFIGLIMVLFFPYPVFQIIKSLFSSSLPADTMYVLVLGKDDANEAGSDRTDFIGVLGLNTKTKEVFLLSIPRDLRVDYVVKKFETRVEKINAIYKTYGLTDLENIIGELLGIPIHRYVILDYNAFKILGDELGPIKIFVKEPMHYDDYQQNLHIHFDPGMVEMDGQKLLEYVRFRYDKMGDLGRIERQHQVLKAVMESARAKLNLFKTAAIFTKLLKEDLETNLDLAEVIALYLKFKELSNLSLITLPTMLTRSADLVVDQEKLNDLKNNIRTFKFSIDTSRPKVVFINNSTGNRYDFERKINKLVENTENLKYDYFFVNLKESETYFKKNENYVLILSEDMNKIQKAQNILDRLNLKDENKFRPTISKGLDAYYSLIYELSSSRIYIQDADLLVLIGS
ncbi:MAG: polyisoprenyl-teichoic acid--peptidoglycan teichoic acid transferase [Thermotogaceae bacterium]|nr:polyisoprenyl-teichoic acid--peptidoglycan teichoic acid transferase [Thermotogaceae bacterium]MDN5337103.1 polyisoprenyl-teichoic acid--peptidoglycan teichoic acid transferase [Thermotogaceae bacterium]